MTSLRILAESAYPSVVASARVRICEFEPFLAPYDVTLQHRPALTVEEYALLQSAAAPAAKARVLARSARRFVTSRRPPHELRLIHRLLLMAPLPGIDPPSQLDVYDFDDALFLGSSAAVNRRFGWAKNEAGRCRAYLQTARLVLAGNEYLAGFARRHARHVEIVPSCVDPKTQPLRLHEERDVLTVGWIGSPSTSAYLAPVLSVLRRLNADTVRFRLVTVGADLGVQEPWLEQRPWSLRSQAGDLESFDIGIMPLVDSEWARGKCGYKLLQYFAAGLPVVASPVGVNPSLVGTGRGILAASEGDWERALLELGGDADGRRQRGAAARTFVEREFSYESWAPRVAEMLHAVAE